LIRGRAPALIGRERVAVSVRGFDRALESARLFGEAEILEQERAGEQGRRRVDRVLARDVGCGPVRGLEVRVALAVAAARCEAEPADEESSGEVESSGQRAGMGRGEAPRKTKQREP